MHQLVSVLSWATSDPMHIYGFVVFLLLICLRILLWFVDRTPSPAAQARRDARARKAAALRQLEADRAAAHRQLKADQAAARLLAAEQLTDVDQSPHDAAEAAQVFSQLYTEAKARYRRSIRQVHR
ncbi:hypothetical protein [Streptomyces canus]|uniref:hypothetical protein n=1 Tax=Streptomyces canus TaxID=58343 RepID=UPI0022531EC5|nr:hypothetical protein [Streptomyces canus]MCX4856647.1 hypothetical protein [Streptomyces canus]